MNTFKSLLTRTSPLIRQKPLAIAKYTNQAMAIEKTAVVVVGGSVVGLSTSLFLAYHDVPHILIEKHPASSLHPRAIGYTARTLEHFRRVGIADKIPEVPASFRLNRVNAKSLAGQWSNGSAWNPDKPAAEPVQYSPTLGSAMAQDKVEAALKERALELGADIRFGVRMLEFSQDDSCVSVKVKDASGREYAIEADYMVAADGHRSPVREALGITMHGSGFLSAIRSVLFRADLDKFLGKDVHQWKIENENVKAFLTTYNDGRWVLIFHDDKERNTEQLREAITQAIGIPDLDFEIITTGRWELSAKIADKYSSGRVFIAGDAAHTLPPNRGGYGANTGIHDAASIAWKLASVRAGISKPELLETYNAERQPVGWNRHQQIFARPDWAKSLKEGAKKDEIIDDDAMEFGELYRSGAVLADNMDDLPVAKRPDEWAGQPGTRAPHIWMRDPKTEERVSTIDLFGKSFSLITQDAKWRNIAAEAGKTLAIDINSIIVGEDVEEREAGAFSKGFGIGENGVSLVRPDGVVAWRLTELPINANEVLVSALRKVLFMTR